MALIDKASLLMVPSTYEAGKLYNVLPSGNRAPDETGSNSGYDQTRADFTFDRGSNAAATRIGSDGLIKKYRENLLLQSNQFDTTWTNNNSTETGGQSGYDGSSDAWLLTSTSTYASIQQLINVSGVFTISLYLKSGSNGGVLLQVIGINNSLVRFNLDDGTLISKESAVISADIQSVGNGWHRVSYSLNGSITTFRIYPADNTGDHGVTGSIYIQNAQLESGLVSTDYLESTSVTGKAGVLIDLPRINYDANGENGALLLEPSRQQLIQYSEYFGGWQKNNNAAVQLADIDSPEGLKNAYEFTYDGTNNGRVEKSVSVTNGATYTFSIYLKNKNISDPTQVFIGLSTAPLQGKYVTVTNEWQRFETTQVANGTIEYPRVSTNGSGALYAFGAQLEAGSYPTSYIPNHGTSAGVTRAAENSTEAVNVTDVPTGYPFAIYVEPYLTNDVDNGAFAFYSNSYQYAFYSMNIYQNKFKMMSRPQAATQNDLFSTSTYSEGYHKVVCLFESETTMKLYVDGSLANSRTDCTNNAFNTGFNDYLIGVFRGIYTNPCAIKKFIVFNEGLTNQECLDITA